MTIDEAELRDLWVRGLSGDATAYRQFLQRLSAYLRAFFRKRLMRWPDDVEDLVQETLLAIHNRRHTYNPDYPLTAWVHAIAHYKLIDMLRRSSRGGALTVSLEDTDPLFSSSDTAADEARHDLGKLLRELPDRQRLPIIHVKIEGLSVVEVAALTGMSVSAVKIGIHRGLRALAAKIRKTS